MSWSRRQVGWWRNSQQNLTLRRPRSGRLEGWQRAPCLAAILRDAALRAAPQDEECRPHQPFRILVTRASMSSLRALYHFQSGWIRVATLASVVSSLASYFASSFTFLLAGEYHTPSASSFCTSGRSM